MIIRLLCLCFSLSASTQLLAEPSRERQATLRNMLKHDCGACHGLTLKGGLGPALLPENLATLSDDFLVKTIQNGRKGTAMPPWKPFITEAETTWLVKQLRQQVSVTNF